jgi:hypothetical protein
MAGITLAQAQAQLETWLAASTAVAAGKTFRTENETLTREDSAQILKMVEFWNGMVKSLSGSTRRPVINLGVRERCY